MKPGDHPQFFRFPAPEGASRESSIRLLGDGQWMHEGELLEHPALAAAFSSWISRHPDDGRFILTNGYDWVYVTIDDAPFIVQAVAFGEGEATLQLSDGTYERWDPATTRVGSNDALYAQVKRDAKGGPYEARFSRHAQMSLEEVLVPVGDAVGVRLGDGVVRLGPGGER